MQPGVLEAAASGFIFGAVLYIIHLDVGYFHPQTKFPKVEHV